MVSWSFRYVPSNNNQNLFGEHAFVIISHTKIFETRLPYSPACPWKNKKSSNKFFFSERSVLIISPRFSELKITTISKRIRRASSDRTTKNSISVIQDSDLASLFSSTERRATRNEVRTKLTLLSCLFSSLIFRQEAFFYPYPQSSPACRWIYEKNDEASVSLRSPDARISFSESSLSLN